MLVRRILGTTLILSGCVILIVQVPSLDDIVVLSLWHGRGIHLSDLFGLAVVVAGIALM